MACISCEVILKQWPVGVGLRGAESIKEMADGVASPSVKSWPINFSLPLAFFHHYDSSKAPDVSTDFQGIPACKIYHPKPKRLKLGSKYLIWQNTLTQTGLCER